MIKQIKLHPIIQSYFEQLESQTDKILLPDESESIHEFRVIYKKLRTIIRLSSNEKKQKNIPKEIKSIYRLLGKIRELDLIHKKIIESTIIKRALKHKFIQLLQQRISLLYKALSKIPIEIILDNNYKKLIQLTDKKSSLKTINKFIQLKWNYIKSTISLKKLPDTSIHSVRKKLKDIFYVTRLLEIKTGKSWIKKRIPKTQLDQYNEILNELGNFQDVCNALQLLNRLNKIQPEAFEKLKEKWLKEKVVLKKSISEMLQNDYLDKLKIKL
jgi:CHAD domain-containing protein